MSVDTSSNIDQLRSVTSLNSPTGGWETPSKGSFLYGERVSSEQEFFKSVVNWTYEKPRKVKLVTLQQRSKFVNIPLKFPFYKLTPELNLSREDTKVKFKAL